MRDFPASQVQVLECTTFVPQKRHQKYNHTMHPTPASRILASCLKFCQSTCLSADLSPHGCSRHTRDYPRSPHFHLPRWQQKRSLFHKSAAHSSFVVSAQPLNKMNVIVGINDHSPHPHSCSSLWA